MRRVIHCEQIMTGYYVRRYDAPKGQARIVGIGMTDACHTHTNMEERSGALHDPNGAMHVVAIISVYLIAGLNIT